MKLTEQQIKNLQQFNAHRTKDDIPDLLKDVTLVTFAFAIMYALLVFSL